MNYAIALMKLAVKYRDQPSAVKLLFHAQFAIGDARVILS
jgi:hypothetical protein